VDMSVRLGIKSWKRKTGHKKRARNGASLGQERDLRARGVFRPDLGGGEEL
jgi:hypothetical protein